MNRPSPGLTATLSRPTGEGLGLGLFPLNVHGANAHAQDVDVKALRLNGFFPRPRIFRRI